MNINLVATIIVIIVAIIVLALIVRASRAKGKAVGTTTVPAEPIVEGHGIADEAAAAIEDVIGQFLGVDAHPDHAGPADELTTLKGLGPKAAARLNEIGITRFAQIAALDEAQTAALDEQMGVFRGRITRDQWVAQARHLAEGDRAGFEERFGKLGG